MSEKFIEIVQTEKGCRLSIKTQLQGKSEFLILETQNKLETKALLYEMKEALFNIEQKLRSQTLKEIANGK